MGHSDIAPLRKIDPGEKFPWKELSTHNIGYWYKQEKKEIAIKTKKIRILFFKNLQKLGYRYFNINKKNIRDIRVIRCFQMRYSPNNLNGKIDLKTYKISCFLTY